VLGEQIRKARKAAGLTQEQLAFKAKVARNYVSLVELDQHSPTVTKLLAIARALGTKASVMIAAVEEEIPTVRSRRQPRRPRQ
jgi:transcriptional regulator with XRE-family HTH domain